MLGVTPLSRFNNLNKLLVYENDQKKTWLIMSTSVLHCFKGKELRVIIVLVKLEQSNQ